MSWFLSISWVLRFLMRASILKTFRSLASIIKFTLLDQDLGRIRRTFLACLLVLIDSSRIYSSLVMNESFLTISWIVSPSLAVKIFILGSQHVHLWSLYIFCSLMSSPQAIPYFFCWFTHKNSVVFLNTGSTQQELVCFVAFLNLLSVRFVVLLSSLWYNFCISPFFTSTIGMKGPSNTMSHSLLSSAMW